jgi:hypothetical protein
MKAQTNGRVYGLVARMQRLSRLRDDEKKVGVEGRLARFYLDQLEGKSPRPL